MRHQEAKNSNFSVSGKNANSPAYSLTFDYIKLIPLRTALVEAEGITKSNASDAATIFYDALASDGAAEFFAANAVGDYVAYTVPAIEAGTYFIKVGFKRYWSRGQFQLVVDGVDQGEVQDQYGSAPSWVEVDLGTKAFGTSGNKEFRFVVKGKSTSSPAFSLTFDYIKLTPVATK